MVTLVDNLTPKKTAADHSAPEGYQQPVQVDTRIPPKPKPALPIVSVNGIIIEEADILEEAQHHPAENPGAALRQAAHALAIKSLLVQKAEALNIAAEPQPDDSGRMETDEDAAIRCLVEGEISVPAATQEECLRYYHNNKPRFSSETIYQVRHILLICDPTDVAAREKAKRQATSLIDLLLEDPARFEQIAREMSACTSAQQGGNLGQITTGDTVEAFEDALEQMQDGELSAEPVETPYGFHVIALDRKIEGSCLPYDQVSERISAWLQAASWSKAVAQYVSILAGEAELVGVDINPTHSPLVQ